MNKNKWLTIILAAVAVIAVIVAVVAVVTGGTPDAPEYSEGPEVGIYYYDVADGEMTLTLSGGNLFTLTSPNTNKTGSYTVEGTSITLDFIKDDDGTATGTIDGEKISLVLNGSTIPFQKKVNYTVSFNGTDLDSVKVVNGKPVAKPQDPSKDNHVFLGWYADAEFTTAFDFENTAIKSDVTVYAKWAEGTPDYTISFDLGYDAEIDAVTAISGKVYGMPVPERQGYVFGGWYASMYDDASKLTYKCDENTVFTGDTTLYAVWYTEGGTALNAPAVTLSNNAITWTPVTGASSYKLTVVGPDGTAIIDNKTVGATSESFDFASKAAGEYKISVVAVANNAANNSAPAVRYFANKTLSKVTNFHVENGILIFGAVENAEKYILNIKCGNTAHNHDAIDNGNSITYYLGNCTMQKGGILITVTAKANGYADSVSKVFAYDKTLTSVENVVYNAETDSLSWNPVAGAVNYVVTITAGGKTYTFDNVSLTSFSTAEFTGAFTVSVVPATDGYNSPDATTINVTKTAPAAPSGLTVNGAVVSWNAVAGATSYEVNIDGKTVTVNTNSVNIATAQLNLTQGQYTVKVKAFNSNNEGSSYCAAVKFGYNAFDSALTYNKNHVAWIPVVSVDGNYEVKVNGEVQQTVANVSSAKIVLTKEGDNVIEVRFVSDAYTSEWSSITVKAYAVEYDSRSTNGVVAIEYLAIGDVMSIPSTGFTYVGHTFGGWYNAPKGTEGNGKLYAEGSVFTGSSYTVVYAGWTPNTYDFTVELGSNEVSNIKNNQVFKVTYSKDFFITPAIPTIPSYTFKGWYTGPDGTGAKLTDEFGNSVAPYRDPSSIKIFPYLVNEAVEYNLNTDINGNKYYTASKGAKIGEITELTIAADINGIPVTEIVASGFNSCYTLTKVNIPDTIKVVGSKAFRYCRELKEINVYVAYPENAGKYETIYSSYEGTLLRDDLGTMYLEYVPQAKAGDFTLPETVTNILENAFYRTSLSSVTIPANVLSVPKYAFNESTTLKTITIAERTEALKVGENAFYKCTAVETVNIPAGYTPEYSKLSAMLDSFSTLKAINVADGNASFSSIDGILTNGTNTILYAPKAYDGDFVVPQGITIINSGAFLNRSNITSVTVPAWVTEIGRDAFNGCTGIKTITFKGSRSDELTIGANAFANHRALTTITFEATENTSGMLDAPITIGTNAFAAGASTKALTAINVKAGTNIVSIGEGAFKNNTVLTDINVDAKAYVGVIGKSAFAYCSALTTVNIPATVTLIDSYAFSRCTALSKINFLTEGATTIDIADYAFDGCTKLGSILLPDHLNEFRSSAFDGCELLKEIKVNPTNTKYTNTADGILFKRTTDGAGNLVYTDILFYPKGLAKDKGGVIDNLPETLVNIGGAAFSNNPYITEIYIPATVTKIDSSAFANCEHLKKLVFKAGGTNLEIGERAFENCTGLSVDFKLPEYTTKIGEYAFIGCEFTSFTIPANVTSIGNGAFYGCKFLKSVTFNSTVDLTIGANANAAEEGVFSGCIELESINLPKTTTTIGKYSFYGCASLKSVTFGTTTNNGGVWTVDSNLTTIGSHAFYGCTSLESVVIPNTVNSIGSYAFAVDANKTCSLSTVYFELGGTEALNIATHAFANNNVLSKIYFPARVELISAETAPDISWIINYEELPAMIKDIFSGCKSLAEINVASENGVTAHYASIDGVLYNAEKTILIYCPAANVGIYENGVPTYEIKVPTSVQLVASGAFNNLTAIKTITFLDFEKNDENYGKQLLTIGNAYNVFITFGEYCPEYATGGAELAAIGGYRSSITKVYLPSHLNRVTEGAFVCKGSKTVELVFNPDAKNITLDRAAFAHSKISKANFPGIKSMGDDTFFEARDLTELTLGVLAEDITMIPNGFLQMYWGPCYALKSFKIPAQITKIGGAAFENCAGITEMTLHEGITSVGAYAFTYTSIKSFVLPSTVKEIGVSAFYGCEKLESFTFALDAEGNSPITQLPNQIFQLCSKLKTINIADLNLTKIGNSAFSGCGELTDIDFTKFTNLTEIGTTSFNGTGLVIVDLSNTKLTKLNTSFQNVPTMTTLILPDTITSVTTNALSSAKALTKLYLGNKMTAAHIASLGDKVGNIDEIYIPDDSVNFYKENGVIYDKAMTTIIHADRNADLTNYVIPNTVKTINKYAFSGTKLGDLVIPESVTTLAQYAFAGADINSVSIYLNKIKKIDTYVFDGSTLKEVIWLNEAESVLTNIANYSFRNTQITSFVFPDSVTTIGSYAINGCVNLESVIFSAKVKTLPTNVLQKCVNVSNIVIQEGTTTISYMYTNVKTGTSDYIKVEEITIPSTVTTINQHAFNSFGNLKKVNFAEGSKLSTVGIYAFSRCVSLESINLPSTVKSLGDFAFNLCSGLASIDLSGTGITSIGESTFQETTNLATVNLSDKVTTIGTNAFLNSGITVFNAPKSLTTISASAFENATKLESVVFPADCAITSLGDATNVNIFKGATSLTTLVIPNTLTSIGDFAFENTPLTTVTLTEPDFPAQLKTIGQKAFYNCNKLTGFDFLENATSIDDYAFYGCTELTKATPGEKLVNLGTLAFGYCNKLETAYIPASVTNMNGNPYGGISVDKISLNPANNAFRLEVENGAKVIYDADGFTIYGVWGVKGDYVISDNVYSAAIGTFMNNDITSITIPKRFGQINDYMFENCTKLAKVTIEHGISSIGDYAFYNTDLTTIQIPSTVTSLGAYCFSGIEKLDNVVIPAAVTVMKEGVFANDTALANVSFVNSDEFVTMGEYIFYNCSSLTEVVLPKHFKSDPEDLLAIARLMGNTSLKLSGANTYSEYTIPAHTFSGTGIVHAKLPFVKYIVTLPIFQNCKNLETITFATGASSGSTDICNPVKNDETKAAWLAGCEKLKSINIGFIGGYTSGEEKVCYDEFGTTIKRMYQLGMKEFHIQSIDFNYYNSGNFNLSDLGEDATIYFDNNTYEEVVEFFKYCPYVSTVKMYDKDGNLLICSTTNGIIASVQDKDGNTIWTNPTTERLRHPDDQEQM